MSTVEVTMTELRQGLGELVNRAAYGGERVILVSRGAPRAVIIGIEEFKRLEQSAQQETQSYQQDPYTAALAEAHAVRECIHQWREEHGIEPLDSTEVLRELREERDDEILGLR